MLLNDWEWDVARGAIAGAAGTAALNIVTYLDMAVRGRPPSDVPAKTATLLFERLGIGSLAGEGDVANNRGNAVGALLGYVDGLGTGAAYGLLRPHASWMPWPFGAAALCAATLLVGEGSATRLGATDWSKWGIADWASDLVPRAAYGAVTALAYDALE